MHLKYLLDTNICIYIAKHQPINVSKKFAELKVNEIGMSIITFGELAFGAKKSTSPTAQTKLIELASIIPVLPLTDAVAQHYATIRAYLEKKGQPIGNNDLWIAAHALTLKVTLVTNNLKEFNRTPDLLVENWVN